MKYRIISSSLELAVCPQACSWLKMGIFYFLLAFLKLLSFWLICILSDTLDKWIQLICWTTYYVWSKVNCLELLTIYELALLLFWGSNFKEIYSFDVNVCSSKFLFFFRELRRVVITFVSVINRLQKKKLLFTHYVYVYACLSQSSLQPLSGFE